MKTKTRKTAPKTRKATKTDDVHPAKLARWEADDALQNRCEAVDLLVNATIAMPRDGSSEGLVVCLEHIGELLGHAMRAVKADARAARNAANSLPL